MYGGPRQIASIQWIELRDKLESFDVFGTEIADGDLRSLRESESLRRIRLNPVRKRCSHSEAEVHAFLGAKAALRAHAAGEMAWLGARTLTASSALPAAAVAGALEADVCRSFSEVSPLASRASRFVPARTMADSAATTFESVILQRLINDAIAGSHASARACAVMSLTVTTTACARAPSCLTGMARTASERRASSRVLEA